MKFSTTTVPEAKELSKKQSIQFGGGIIGLPGFTEAELFYNPEEVPFMWLKGTGSDKVMFVVVEPAGLIQDYEIEISDADVEALDLRSGQEALILNIVTLPKGTSTKVTVDLIGPIVVNRRTLKARQIVIGNCHKFSARHVLFDASKEAINAK